MKVNFEYNKEKDIWCLLNKGKSSNNSQNPTKQYTELVAMYGENPSADHTSSFIEKYLSDNQIDIKDYLKKYQQDWDNVAEEYQKKAEAIFGVSLSNDITAYLTINSRCPYNIQDKSFFVSVTTKSPVLIVMHELWHFYTWYGLGADQEEKLGKQKYNDIKEALTVLLNVECKDLLTDGINDTGYPQHKELREKILEIWGKEKNIKKLWEQIIF